jgi:hypothetical protein
MTAREQVEQARGKLVAIVLARALLGGAAAAIGSWALSSLALAWTFGRASVPVAALSGVAAGIATAALLVRRAGGLRPALGSVALWVEEQVPALQYALVTAVEGGAHSATLDESLRDGDWMPGVGRVASRSLRTPGAALLLALTMAVAARPLVPVAERAGTLRAARDAGRDGAPGGPLQITARVTPPAYTRQPALTLHNPSVIRALEGSALAIEAAAGDSLRAMMDGRPLPPGATGPSRLALRLGTTPFALRLEGRAGARVIAVEPVADSAPVVTLRAPARDTVLREPRGTIPLGADLRDDLGLRTGRFEYIVSSGEGETFTFNSGVLAARALSGARQATLEASLSLERLALEPGDIVHLRAVAHDARPDSTRGLGASETRTIRIARAGEYDSVAVEAAAPPEADKSILSQRMIINMTEALVRKRRSLAREPFSDEARRIARDQARLRRQVGEIVFSRLGDDPTGEHFHGDGHDHSGQEMRPPLTPDELLKAAERATAAAADAAVEAVQDETPVVAINRPLLEAYNAMWDAGREMEQITPERALPHMYRALAAIQRARAAERLYLRSRPPRAVVDIDRVRLQGRDRGAPSPRTPRESTAPRDRAAIERFARALGLAAAAPAAAADSLLLLRIDLLDRNPRAATALGAAAEALRQGRDATESLQQSRRALETMGSVSDSLSRWSGAR